MNDLVVIDTNVLISALLSKYRDAATVRVLEAVFDGTIIPVFNDEILEEYSQVLRRPKFKFDNGVIELLLNVMKANGIFAERLITNERLPDPKILCFMKSLWQRRRIMRIWLQGMGNIFLKSLLSLHRMSCLRLFNKTFSYKRNKEKSERRLATGLRKREVCYEKVISFT